MESESLLSRVRRRPSLSVSDGIPVHAVVEINRNRFMTASGFDTQEDITVLAVFTNLQDAESYLSNHGVDRTMMIHTTVLNPSTNIFRSAGDMTYIN